MRAIYISLIAILFTLSCKSKSDYPDISGKWDFRNMFNVNAFPANKDELLGEEQILDINNSQKYGSYFVFDKNGSFRCLQTDKNDSYITGKWTYNESDSMISFQCDNNFQIKPLKLIYRKNNQLSLCDDKEIKGNPNHTYMNGATANVLNRYKYMEDQNTVGSDLDYTLEKLNKWRFKPTVSESDEEIKQRLLQSLEYAVIFLKNNIKQYGQNFRITGIKLPVTFTYKGISLKSFESCVEWQNTYFNKNEASRAYRLILDASNKLYPPNSNQPKDLNLFYTEKLIDEIKGKL